MAERLRYYGIAYRWARSMDYSRTASFVLMLHGWRKKMAVPIPGPPPQEAIDLGRELAEKYGW